MGLSPVRNIWLRSQQCKNRERLRDMWIAGSAFLVVWFILKFVFHKGGFVHILLLTGISIIVIQLVAVRKARYQRS